ncbi:hypothetical protein GCM10029964_126860 [Kibdelosporangium lantanae]
MASPLCPRGSGGGCPHVGPTAAPPTADPSVHSRGTAQGGTPAGGRGRHTTTPGAPEPDDPLPPAPPQTEAEAEEEMLAEASQNPTEGERVQAKDPEEVMIELLAQELGARKISP